MKNEYKIFFAIPFDSLTQKIYEDICGELTSNFNNKGYALTTVLGNKQIGPSQDYLNIMSFRAQNTELHKQFFKDIADSDIVVADLTNNNPNVHVELGIALVLNKNILRVTGRPMKEIGFDIQNFEVYPYKNKGDLLNKIKNYLKIFLKIKNLNFSPKYKSLYKKIDFIKLPGGKENIKKDTFFFTSALNNDSIRDGAIKFKFKFLNNLNHRSWLGIYFRASREFLYDSYLLYVRKDGSVELAIYPGPKIINVQKLKQPKILNKEVELMMEIENNELIVKINEQNFNFSNLEKQNSGNMVIAAWECSVQATNIKLINRDTY
ncbi:MAG: hypothetical protein PHI58_00590 [Candidatus Omnitrophica bacterium]|nr:hypothetical protein [Candidatus Omnitrophota bacterium]